MGVVPPTGGGLTSKVLEEKGPPVVLEVRRRSQGCRGLLLVALLATRPQGAYIYIIYVSGNADVIL